MKKSKELERAIRNVDNLIEEKRITRKRIRGDFERTVVSETARDIVKKYELGKDEALFLELTLNEMLTKLKGVDEG